MYFEHDQSIWQRFPQLTVGVMHVAQVNAKPLVADEVDSLHDRARDRLSGFSETEMPEIVAWRKAYAEMGLKPTKYRCAAESLLRRFRKDDNLPRFHPLVDLCNALSLAYAIPVAVFDTENIEGGITVREASGVESYHAFNGEIESPDKGEIVFADDQANAHSRRWVYRQSKKSVVSQATESALVVVEAHHADGELDVRRLIDELALLVEKAWGNAATVEMLRAERSRFEFRV